MQLPIDLQREVDNLYAVFLQYGRRQHMESCPCCKGSAKVRTLYRRPLAQLTPEDLQLYLFSAMTTMGDVEDFRHFLPRIFELLSDYEFAASEVNAEVVIGKLRYGHWETWPVEEQEAIRKFLLALWRLKLRVPPPQIAYEHSEIGNWLCAIAQVEWDLAPYLEAWDLDLAPAAAANFSRFVAEHSSELFDSVSPTGFWKDTEDQWRQVARWVRSKQKRQDNASCSPLK